MVISAAARAAKALALRNLRKLRIKKNQTQKPRRRRVKLPPKVGSVKQQKAEARAMNRIQEKYGLKGIKITPDIVRRIAREEAHTRHLERKFSAQKIRSYWTGSPDAPSKLKKLAKEKAWAALQKRRLAESKLKARADNKIKWEKRRENDFLNKYGAKKVYGIGSAFNRKVAKDKFIKKNILDKDKADILKGILPPAPFKAKSFGNWPRQYTGGPGRPGGGPPKKPKKDGLGFGPGNNRVPKRRPTLENDVPFWIGFGGIGAAAGFVKSQSVISRYHGKTLTGADLPKKKKKGKR